jgi:hypothetical protein
MKEEQMSTTKTHRITSVRDHARKLLAEQQPESEIEPDELEPDEVETLLSGIPTEQLQAELTRRGITT